MCPPSRPLCVHLIMCPPSCPLCVHLVSLLLPAMCAPHNVSLLLPAVCAPHVSPLSPAVCAPHNVCPPALSTQGLIPASLPCHDMTGTRQPGITGPTPAASAGAAAVAVPGMKTRTDAEDSRETPSWSVSLTARS
ncbi:hypothetical protein FKM82_025724, partial [Ascaphus truei]